MKKTITISVVVIAVVVLLVGLYFYLFVGITKKQQFAKCVARCMSLVTLESSKPACGPRCTEITGYVPKEEVTVNEYQGVKVYSKPSTGQGAASLLPDFENREYYCGWVWPQKIIDRETKDAIITCPHEFPWCDYADFKFEHVGCCQEAEHRNCLHLFELL